MGETLIGGALAGGAQLISGAMGAGEQRAAAERSQQAFQRAIDKATAALTGTTGQAVEELRRTGATAAEQFQPYAGAGTQALEQLKAALGLPSTATFQPEATPLFGFQRGLLEESTGRRTTAAGIQGPAAEQIYQRGLQPLIAQEGERQIGRLSGLLGTGFTGAQNIANILQGTGQRVAQSQMNLGQTLGNLLLGGGQQAAQTQATLGNIGAVQAGNIGNLAGNLFQNYLLSQALTGGGTGGTVAPSTSGIVPTANLSNQLSNLLAGGR